MEVSFINQLYQAHRKQKPHSFTESGMWLVEWDVENPFSELADRKYESIRAFELHFQSLKLELFQILEKLEFRMPHSAFFIEDTFEKALPAIRARLIEDATSYCLVIPQR